MKLFITYETRKIIGRMKEKQKVFGLKTSVIFLSPVQDEYKVLGVWKNLRKVIYLSFSEHVTLCVHEIVKPSL